MARRRLRRLRRVLEDDEAVVAHLDVVCVLEGHGCDHGLSVHVRPVEAADVLDRVPRAEPDELGMPPGDRHVVQEDVAVRVAAGGDEVQIGKYRLVYLVGQGGAGAGGSPAGGQS